MPQREHHRGLASHRVADERDRLESPIRVRKFAPHDLRERVGHVDVAEGLGPGGFAVVRHVDEHARELVAEAARDRAEVAAAPHEAVEEHDLSRARTDQLIRDVTHDPRA